MATSIQRSSYVPKSTLAEPDQIAGNKLLTLLTTVEQFIANRCLEKIAKLHTKQFLISLLSMTYKANNIPEIFTFVKNQI